MKPEHKPAITRVSHLPFPGGNAGASLKHDLADTI